MKVFDSVDSVRSFLNQKRKEERKIGLVPTMGALHQGHMQLVREALKSNDLVVTSIFVNPSQFDKKQDLEKYPRSLDEDIEKLKAEGCEVIFAPTENEIYSTNKILDINVGYLDKIMEGKFRSGHFSGVALIVCKLLNIIHPDNAYFGQKDLQQLVLIKKLVSEFNFDTKVISVPTIREKSGLALSSRNLRLSTDEKNTAANIYQGLSILKDNINSGKSIIDSIEVVERFYSGIKGFELEYLEVVDSEDLTSVTNHQKDSGLALCVAGYVGGVRLLDNICI